MADEEAPTVIINPIDENTIEVVTEVKRIIKKANLLKEKERIDNLLSNFPES